MKRKLVIILTGLLLSTLVLGLADDPDPRESSWASTPPRINGVVEEGEWEEALIIIIPYGNVWIKNDGSYIYFLINIFGDTGNDFSDSFALVFDVNRDGAITPNVDIIYQAIAGDQTANQPDFGYFKSSNGEVSSSTDTQSRLGVGFSDSIALASVALVGSEGGLEEISLEKFPPKYSSSHRIWELAINLEEIRAAPGEVVRLNLAYTSEVPSLRFGKIHDFSDLIPIILAKPAEFESTLGSSSVSGGSLSIPGSLIRPCAYPPGKSPKIELEPISGSSQAGVFDWLEISDLDRDTNEYMNSHAIALIKIPNPGNPTGYDLCTGFLVAPDILMTANHCIKAAYKDSYEVINVKAVFNWEKSVPKDQRETYICNIVIKNWPKQDIILLKCQDGPIEAEHPGPPGERWGMARLCDEGLTRNQPIYLIHQNCFPPGECDPSKKISFGLIDDPDWNNNLLTHDADTFPGSSGAPVFSAISHNVIGVHLGGLRKIGERYVINRAMSIAKLKLYLEEAGLWSTLLHCEK